MIFVGGIEFDFVLVLGSKVTCFWCGGSESTAYEPKLACFECDDRLTCFFYFCVWVVVVEMVSVFGCGP